MSNIYLRDTKAALAELKSWFETDTSCLHPELVSDFELVDGELDLLFGQFEDLEEKVEELESKLEELE